MAERLLYHGSGEIVEFPEVRKTRFQKDFSWGFYCTNNREQAEKWTERRGKKRILNKYIYIENPELKILKFERMSDEWLDFIAECRSGRLHAYDIVEGPMADDTIWNFVADYISGEITRAAFWELARFRHPTHQMSFHTIRALDCLTFAGSEEIKNDKNAE
ncbi:MAG: DUF3990 domain-containing protein [Candidatus Ornithomonoglobus sp.]